MIENNSNNLLDLTTLSLKNSGIDVDLKVQNLSKVKAKDLGPAIEALLAEYKEANDAVKNNKDKPNWQNTVAAMDKVSVKFSAAWSAVSHLTNVDDSAEMREEYQKILPLVTEFFSNLSQDKDLYLREKELLANDKTLNATQNYILQQSLLGYELSGIGLDKEEQDKFKKLTLKLSELQNKFGNNVLDATNAFTKHVTDESELEGIPKFTLDAAAEKAKVKGLDGWVFGIDPPTYMTVITYAKNRELRKELYYAYVTRASELGVNTDSDNTALIDDILNTKQELAEIVSFDNYAEYSLATKMAKSADEVINFLQDIIKEAKPFAVKELATLTEYAKKKDNIKEIEAYDMSYYSTMYKKEVFDIDHEELRPYFVEKKVMQGMLTLSSDLYNISFVDITNDFKEVIYHDSVKVYAVKDNKNKMIGWFVTDLYARETKRGGAWMAEWFSRVKTGKELILPSAFLNCNFAPRAEGGLLTHSDVETLFHEFGHTMHKVLTQVDYLGASGMSNVPWDGVELPSQFFENFAWQYPVIKNISGHFETGEVLPEEMFNKLAKTKNYNAGLFIVRQIEFGLFDMKIHSQQKIKPKMVANILNEVRKEVAVSMPPEYNRFQNSFTHIFDGGYSAGYYSYMWADVLSCDAFNVFYPDRIFDQKLGIKFKEEILEVGGSRDFMTSYQKFSGRRPSVKSLLLNYGLIS